uniref:Uncharacterized protein n=1 Tax=viral metagenome TaxID=1070528 RepID=A0A6M3MCY6_9ZZZZ
MVLAAMSIAFLVWFCVECRCAEIVKDSLIPDQWIVYDDKGNRSGVVKKDSLIPGRFRVYDKTGKLVGEIVKGGT